MHHSWPLISNESSDDLVDFLIATFSVLPSMRLQRLSAGSKFIPAAELSLGCEFPFRLFDIFGAFQVLGSKAVYFLRQFIQPVIPNDSTVFSYRFY